MIRFAIFFIVMAINVSTIPALASQCASSKEIGASLARLGGHSQAICQRHRPPDGMSCLCCLILRIGSCASARPPFASATPTAIWILAINSEIDAFNNLLAAKCGN
jgi:hypothetical protein